MESKEAIRILENNKCASIKGIDYSLINDTFDFAIEAIEFQEKHKWISVEDRLPNKESIILCFCPMAVKGYECSVRKFNGSDFLGFSDEQDCYYMDDDCQTNITHWMPNQNHPKRRNND